MVTWRTSSQLIRQRCGLIPGDSGILCKYLYLLGTSDTMAMPCGTMLVSDELGAYMKTSSKKGLYMTFECLLYL